MEFRIARDSFQRALQKVQGIVERRNTMPILSNVLIEAEGDRIDMTATDLEVGMKSSYATQVVTPGKITVSAKKLYEIIKELPDQEITFSTRENDWVEVRCGKAQFSLVGLSPEEFPYFPQVRDENFVELENGLIRRMIDETSYAICNDETKFNLNGIFTQAAEENGSPKLRMVATDGHRLSLVCKPVGNAPPAGLARGVILPRKGVFELRKMAEEEGSLELGFMDNSAVIRKGDTVVVMRLVDGDFPDYGRVIPTSNDRRVPVDRNDFLHSLRRMSILSSDKYKGIKLDIRSGNIEISSSNPELGEAREDLETDYQGENVVLRFNAKYLIDVLSTLEEEQVELALKDELSPAIVRSRNDDDFLAVIMPMRL
ncbi:MAG TPA: DNA polymerase III subunit beta [Verrucomicrobiae bacterium]|nr:DNA polymerase III subunit beta [Verrucomicrobiae bacterium]